MRPPSLLAPLGGLLLLGLLAGTGLAVQARSDDAEAADPSAAKPVVAEAAAIAPAAATAGPPVEVRTELVLVPHATVQIEDSTLPLFWTEVRVTGVDGVRRTVSRTTDRDGVIVSPVVLVDELATPPVDEVVAVGTKLPVPPEPEVGVWDRLAQCESGGNWSINTGNGYSGGLQFLPSTWRSLGGTGLPHEHSRGEQIRIATKLRDSQGGYGAWPGCARSLGLPR